MDMGLSAKTVAGFTIVLVRVAGCGGVAVIVCSDRAIAAAMAQDVAVQAASNAVAEATPSGGAGQRGTHRNSGHWQS